MCHTRELAFQISKEYERFSKYMPTVKAAVFFGGLAIKKDEDVLKKNCPHIVVGTPGRILALTRNKTLSLKNVKHFVLDECDKMLEQLGMFFLLVRLSSADIPPRPASCSVISQSHFFISLHQTWGVTCRKSSRSHPTRSRSWCLVQLWARRSDQSVASSCKM